MSVTVMTASHPIVGTALAALDKRLMHSARQLAAQTTAALGRIAKVRADLLALLGLFE